MFIVSGIPLFITFYMLVFISRWLYRILYVYPKEKRKIIAELEAEESIRIDKINEQIINATKGIQTNPDPLWKKVQQNFIDNHARSMLEDHYLNVRKALSERQDFEKKYVQANYESIEAKLSTLYEERPYTELDIISEFPQTVIDAYTKFSSAWFKMTNNSELILRYGNPILFPSFTFGRVSVGDIPIPSFFNNDGDIIYFFPSFAVILKSNFSIAFYQLDKISIHISERVIKYPDYQCPKDSIIVGESWAHSNKDGSRDARYADNQRYMHCKIADIMIVGVHELFSFEASNGGLSSLMNMAFLHLKNILYKPIKTNLEQEDSAFDLESADPLFIEVASQILSTNNPSRSSIQRHFNIGYNRAGRILDQIEAAGIICISPASSEEFVAGTKYTIRQFDDWKNFQKRIKQEEITITTDIEVKDNTLTRSRHYVGEKHPTQPWVWTEYAPGKFDWRKDKGNGNNQLKDQGQDNNPLSELNSLIGLNAVKEEITKLQNFIKIQLVRKTKGLKLSPISYHCVFTGNPGTGKTTVARIVAKIYKDLGILTKGHLVETDRSGLVAEYIGQTAAKTNKVIDSALDGVLFIDEAYSLAPSSHNDFGHEAIATLLKRMEDDRERLIVILAGYGDEMQNFIDSNPGLQSRFNRYIHFDDYSAEDLFYIFELNLQQHQYKLSESAKNRIKVFFNIAHTNKDKNFGNGRFVRNVFEKTLQNQASRLSQLSNLSKEDLQLIIDEDLPKI